MSKTRVLATAIAAFILLAMPMAALGVAWPSIADELSRPLADLGVLIVVYVAGYFLVTLVNGELTRRLGSGILLVTSALIAVLSLVAVALVTTWTGLIIALVVLGSSGGLIDAGINARIAVEADARAMGLLHAGFGVGSVIGPLVITGSLAFDIPWQAGFGLAAVLQSLVALALILDREGWDMRRPPVAATRARPVGSPARLILSLLIFGLYAGIEVAAGEWSFALLTEDRAMHSTVAGLVVAAYWGGLTVARVILGLAGDRGRPKPLLVASASLGAAGLVLLWWSPTGWVAATGLVVTGFGLGPYFPMQMLLTPTRFGAAFMPWMSGYQVAAASVGAAAIPGGIGVVVASLGIETVAPVLAGAAICLVAATVLLDRPSRLDRLSITGEGHLPR